ncbi:MAG: DUF1553 domain-containing protein [Planctomycetales bacterium]|nr:DUF1553 domain-containing protein [Planctomycetales bacterium]
MPWIIAFCLLPIPRLHAQEIDSPVVGEATAVEAEYFEQFIRPALVEHCYECHAVDSEAAGGLLLDSASGWQAGSDSGQVIVPGDPQSSRLMQALRYDDPDLKMPPDGKLPAATLAAIERWIARGAYDPRPATEHHVPQVGLAVSEADSHWAYRKIHAVRPPPTESFQGLAATSPVDAFLNEKLRANQLEPAPQAANHALVRRLYFDLTGLAPPVLEKHIIAPETINELEYERLVDQLLNSPRFGEHFARKWMDVVRYAESITLRGFVLPEAWRYRDYLIQSFAEDRPFDQMIREQIAGDLLEGPNLRERQMQLIATTFLAMGNNNLEQQDKQQLEMDYLDEQLETIGRAFLGQTLGCARCHDHKFDPIPMRDYYALAGTLRSAVALEHANLSMWIEEPLPLAAEQEANFQSIADELEKVNSAIEQINSMQAGSSVKDEAKSIALTQLTGYVIDDSQAKLSGHWKLSNSVGPYVGSGYRHDENRNQGFSTATFEPTDLPAGQYDVRLSYSASSNRASNVQVLVFGADGPRDLIVNQRKAPKEDGRWHSLGVYRCEANSQAYVLVSNESADGHVIIDAVQFLPVDDSIPLRGTADASHQQVADAAQPSSYEQQLKQLQSRKKQLESNLAERPRFLTVVEKRPPTDVPLHIRGDVHNLGEVVPRGFLTALPMPADSLEIPADASGRRQLAEWISSPHNSLTARVYANRVWSWLMGQGLVATPNNLGTTGSPPSHPELLDWLAQELIDSGWSTKHLIRIIVLSEAYRRQYTHNPVAEQLDPNNRLYWRGQSRRLSPEALRDAMLQISGELDSSMHGSLIRPGTKADYDYQHQSTRRSIYHPVFRNALPELFEAFDFADPSVSIGARSRSTVATQPLSLLNDPWVAKRAQGTANRLLRVGQPINSDVIHDLYLACYFRSPTVEEVRGCLRFLDSAPKDGKQLELLIHSLFAALDFRYLE